MEPPSYEDDLVHHCDNDTWGEYLHTRTITDVLLGWTEIEPLKYRSERTVKCGVETIRSRMSYPVEGLDFDGGSEFINDIMFRTAASAASCSPAPSRARRTTNARSSRRTVR